MWRVLVPLVLASGCGRLSFGPIDSAADSSPDSFVPVAPLATYPLNEGTGQMVANSRSTAGGTLGATATAGSDDPTWVQGKFGEALLFDNTDDRVFIAYSSDLYLDSTNHDAITISAWIWPMPASRFRDVFQIGGESSGATLGILDTGLMRFALRNVQGPQTSKLVDSTITLAPNSWYYVVATSDAVGMDLHIYDDAGTLLDHASASNRFTWRTGSDGIAIGNNPLNDSGMRGLLNSGNEPFGGIVDEVRVYDVAISEAQIQLDRVTAL